MKAKIQTSRRNLLRTTAAAFAVAAVEWPRISIAQRPARQQGKLSNLSISSDRTSPITQFKITLTYNQGSDTFSQDRIDQNHPYELTDFPQEVTKIAMKWIFGGTNRQQSFTAFKDDLRNFYYDIFDFTFRADGSRGMHAAQMQQGIPTAKVDTRKRSPASATQNISILNQRTKPIENLRVFVRWGQETQRFDVGTVAASSELDNILPPGFSKEIVWIKFVWNFDGHNNVDQTVGAEQSNDFYFNGFQFQFRENVIPDERRLDCIQYQRGHAIVD
jgi:hypothetical protein